MRPLHLQEQWTALRTIVTKEVLRFSRIWVQTLLPPMVTTALYFIIFGGLIGSRIGDMEGHRYMDFIVPGLIMLAVITNSYSNVVSSFFSSKFQRHIEELMVSPVPNSLIIIGFVGGGMARGLAVGLAVTIVSLFFSPLSVHNLPVALSVVVLTSILFSLAGLINGVFARSFDEISIMPTFVLTPLTYLGGVFYSVSLLPDFWQDVSKL
ncbi:MAG TPA: ABC transporter permease, partial [Thioalkalivibrio sp.]|nr:ABC transporter permease [Thioalkalivibrio sp.]